MSRATPFVSAVGLASLTALAPCSQEAAKPAASAAEAGITRAELERHVRFLASDELGGRAPLSDGAQRAAEYLADGLKSAGLEPAGDGGTFFQATELRRFVHPSVPRLVFYDDAGAMTEAKFGVDFNLAPRGPAHSTAKLPLRFFYDYNHSRMPLTGNPAEAIYFSASREDKRRILAQKGIESLADWGLEFTVVSGDQGLEPGKPRDSYPPRLLRTDAPDGCDVVELRGPLRVGFERRKYSHAQLLVEETVDERVDRNVVARIRGVGTSEHPELAQDVVLLSANYDHSGALGKKSAEDDVLFNGADDNASGCAALLELARAFAAGPKPARTLVFLFTASEEEDDSGSRHYLAAPAEPLAKTVCALCLERVGRPDELAGGAGKVWLTGYGRSNLGKEWKELGLDVGADPRLDQKFFQRFHAYAFTRGGLVAQSFSSYGLQPEIGTPADEADTLDYAHLEAVTRHIAEAVRTLADGRVRPTWLEKAHTRAEQEKEAAEATRERLRERRKRTGEDDDDGDAPKEEKKSGDEKDGAGGAAGGQKPH